MKADANFKESLIQGLIIEARDLSCAVATFNSELRNLRETVDSLTKIIKEGNGQASLLTRVLLLERVADEQSRQLKAAGEALAKIDQEDRIDKRERSKNRWGFYGTIVPSVLALVAAILALVLK